MDNLELAWQTFEFHSSTIADLEEQHLSNLKKLKIFTNKQVPATKREKLNLRNKITACCNKLINSYSKHIACLNELIILHDTVHSIPVERETDIQLFNDLKSVSATLLEEMKRYKEEVSDILS
jgi:hypothetical protein